MPTPRPRARSPYAIAAELIDPKVVRYRHDPVLWATQRGGIELWSKQEEILRSVRRNPKTAVHSCHQIGKSFTAATAVCWWLDVHPPGEAFVLTTAPTGAQVKAILWREINKLHSRLGLPGRVNLTEWYMGNELVALGRKPDEHNPTAMQGTHARYFLVVLDEACGIPKELWDAASTLTANPHSRTFAIGNPDDAATEFGNVCLLSTGWNVIGVGAQDTPNFSGEPISASLADMLVTPSWYQDRMENWGAESALFMSKCDGQFPVGMDPFVVVPLQMAQRCREVPANDSTEVVVGIDVGAGGDRTVLRERVGNVAGREAVFIDADPMRSVGKIVHKLNEWNAARVNIDPIGVGWGVMGRLKELSHKHTFTGERTHNATVTGVNFGASPSVGKEKRFLNKRAEVWWDVGREMSRQGLWNLKNVDEDTLRELTTPRYEIMDSYGKIKVEPKDEVIKRTKRSPDRADSLLLAFYDPNFRGVTPKVDMTQGSLANGNLRGAYGNLGQLTPFR